MTEPSRQATLTAERKAYDFGKIIGVMSETPSVISPTRKLEAATWGIAAALLVICAAAFFLRTWFLRDRVHGGDIVCFQDNDPWYHYRVLQWQVKNLPWRFTFDPYAVYPGGQGVPVGPFFDASLAAILWSVGLGAPSQAMIDLGAAYYAPALAVLACLATFAAGRAIFDRWTGLIAAAALGLLPGTFFVRSSLGFLDHHVMEVLLSTCVLWLLASALERGEGGPFTGPLRNVTLIRPVAAGLALGCYLLTWVGGNFLLAVLFAWGFVQHLGDQFADRPGGRLARVMAPCFCVALAVAAFYPDYAWGRFQIHGIIAGIALFVLLDVMAHLRRRRRLRPGIYSAMLLGLVIAGVGIAYVIAPRVVSHAWSELGRLAPGAAARTITEARPIIWTSKGYSWMPLWEMFGTTFPIAAIGLVLLGCRAVMRPRAPRVLFMVWSAIVIGAMFGQGRFSYYAAPVIAILVAWTCRACTAAAWSLTTRRAMNRREPVPRARRQNRVETAGESKGDSERVRGNIWCTGAVAVASLAIAFVPNARRLPEVVSFYDGPSAEWSEALTWLRKNSPEPFGNAEAYFAACAGAGEARERLDYSRAYGVMSWWDYGYWISGIARRPPNSNPTQAGAVPSARFLLAQTEEEAWRILDDAGSRYIVLDWLLPRWEKPGDRRVRGKFSALPVWTGDALNAFYERVVMKTPDGRIARVFLYYPPYFQSALVRMFIFSCGPVRVGRPVKVYTLGKRDGRGENLRMVTSMREFDTYESARAFVEQTGDENTVIASESPFVSCIPMSGLRRIRLVHRSPTTVATIHGRSVSPVAVFEYRRE
ncbi:MAG: hypothetical protein DCC65_06940 [Planctomycetota bacterium]|nr:MAG: hypothetical protein DCC65_06940 [Planctomycetota bacterium]